MKKALCIVLALILALSMIACGGKKDDGYTIVFVGGETSNQWYSATEAGVKAYAEETGVDFTFRGMASSDPTDAVSIITNTCNLT